MPKCLIDNIDSAVYGFEYLSKTMELREVEKFGGSWPKNSILPFPSEIKGRYIKCTAIFIFKDFEREFENKKSIFLSKILKCVLKFSDTDYFYKAEYSSPSTEKIGLYKQVSIDFLITEKYLDEITVNSTSKTIDIDNTGTETTPAYVEILSTIDQIDMTLTGLTSTPIPFKNLHANQVIIIDPENGTITEGANKTNKFNDIDIWEFPRLRPGANHITFNRDNVTVKIKYKPRFI